MWKIRRNVLEGMLEHARQEFPLECCGLLGGRRAVVDRRFSCRNALADEKAFSIGPDELIGAFRLLRREQRRLAGIYHSHPRGGGEPSRVDFLQHYYPEALCWIISFQDGEAVVRCFEWTRGGFAEVEFKILDKPRGWMATTTEEPGSRLDSRPEKDNQEVFRAIRDLGPPELLGFLEQVAYLLPEDLRYRLRRVVSTAGREGDPLQRVLEIVRAQWEGLRADDSLRVAVIGPAQSGKSSLIAALGEGNVERISRIFSLVDLQGLDEYLGYGRREGIPEEVASADVILMALDGSRGFTDQTLQLVRMARSLNKPLLLVLNKIDLVKKARHVLSEAKKSFGVPVVAVSVYRRDSIRRLLRAIVAAHPRALYPLTQSLPGFRRGICRGIAVQAAFGSGLVGAIPIPVGDVLPVTAIQTAMLLKIARAHGFRINRERARELVPLFLGGLLVREGSRKLSQLFPEKRPLISISVAGVWTYLVGLASVSYFSGLNELAERNRPAEWELP